MTAAARTLASSVDRSPASPEERAIVRRARTTGRSRAIVVGAALAAATFVALCVEISVGDFHVPLVDVATTIFGHGNSSSDFIVNQLRLPRSLTAVLVGAAFGLSGAIFQSLARNPLASPDIIGITAGAATAAVTMIVVVGAGGFAVSVGALIGSLVTALAIYLLAYKHGVSTYRLVLVGIGLSAVLVSITEYLLTRADIVDAQRATVWITGSLNGRTWGHVRPLALSMIVLVPAALVLARPLRALQLGDDTAKQLGVRVERSRLALIVVGVALAAIATAAAGPIAFVAFVAAPIARRLVNAPVTLVPAALAGALLLLVSDVVGRRIIAPTEVPVGIVTGILGAPYLIWLLARSNRVGRGG